MTTNIFNIQSQRDVEQQGNRNKVERKRKTVRVRQGGEMSTSVNKINQVHQKQERTPALASESQLIEK